MKKTILFTLCIAFINCKKDVNSASSKSSSPKPREIKVVSESELKDFINSISIEEIEVTNFESFYYCYLFTAIKTKTKEEIYLIGARRPFFENANISAPSYFKDKDSLYIGKVFNAYIGPTNYKYEGNEALIIYSDYTIKRFSEDTPLKPLYNIENTYELLYSGK